MSPVVGWCKHACDDTHVLLTLLDDIQLLKGQWVLGVVDDAQEMCHGGQEITEEEEEATSHTKTEQRQG